MKIKKINGKETNINIQKYRIDWDKKCRSKMQFNVKQFFRKYWSNHCCLEEFRIPGSLMTIDIVNLTKKLAIEINGNQHSEFNKFFHKNNITNYRLQMERDVKKEDWCEKNGFTLIEIYQDDIEKLDRKWFKEKYNIEII